jgi:hypothetical protein
LIRIYLCLSVLLTVKIFACREDFAGRVRISLIAIVSFDFIRFYLCSSVFICGGNSLLLSFGCGYAALGHRWLNPLLPAFWLRLRRAVFIGG